MYASMPENERGLWTLQVIVREFNGLIVSVYCQVSQKLSLVSERWYNWPYWLLWPCYVLTTLMFVVDFRAIGNVRGNTGNIGNAGIIGNVGNVCNAGNV